MKTLRILAPATLLLLASSCASSNGGGSAPAPSQGASSAAKSEEDTKELADKLEKAELKLKIAQLDAENGAAATARSVESAKLQHELAAQALANFLEVQLPLETASSELSLDRSRQRVKESQQELEELEKMYAQEEFADLTKELVLDRGRTSLAMAKRSLELEEKRAAQRREFEWPRRERELTDKVAAAERGLQEAETRAAKGELERKLSLMDAEAAVTKAREALEESAEGAS